MTLEGALIQDIGDHVYSNAYVAEPARPGDWALAYQGRECLLRVSESGLEFPHVGDVDADANQLIFLFCIDGERYFLAPDGSSAEGFGYMPLREFRFLQPRYRSFAGITGNQLRGWYAGNRFCGRCGHAMERVATSREIACPSCANVVYPKIMPAVICGITWGDKILLTKYAGKEYTRYALVAGFNEVGETLEDTCRREVMEEVGLRIKNIRYYKDQPWPFSSTLLAGFYCDLDGDPTIHVDHDELKLAVWMDRSDLPSHLEDTSSLTNEMIMHFRNGWEG